MIIIEFDNEVYKFVLCVLTLLMEQDCTQQWTTSLNSIEF